MPIITIYQGASGEGQELAASVAEALFPFENPLGKTVVLSKHDYTVIGVLDERLSAGGAGPAAEEFNSDVYVPVSTCRARFSAG